MVASTEASPGGVAPPHFVATEMPAPPQPVPCALPEIAPIKAAPIGRAVNLRMEDVAGAKAGESGILAAVDDRKPQHAVKGDGTRHVVRRQGDGADARDHRPMPSLKLLSRVYGIGTQMHGALRNPSPPRGRRGVG